MIQNARLAAPKAAPKCLRQITYLQLSFRQETFVQMRCLPSLMYLTYLYVAKKIYQWTIHFSALVPPWH